MFNKNLPRGVVLLSFASLFNDIASEAIYPLLPIFFTSVLGASVVFIGAIEGAAETISSLAKLFSGYLSDKFKRREPFVLFGYSVACLVRPLIGLVAAPTQAFAIRLTDRLAKGVRSAPRDAWLASLTTPQRRGLVFGFNRSMDHAGAMIGPLLASIFLFFFPGQYRILFLLAFIPGLLVVAFVYSAMKETTALTVKEGSDEKKKFSLKGVKLSSFPPSFRKFLVVILLFTLGNSTDAFLLLRLRDLGLADAWIPLVWSIFHLVKTISSSFGGAFSDRVGRKRAIILGWLIYAFVYLGFGLASQLYAVLFLFMLYGTYYGLSEAPEKALVADLVPSHAHGTAYGLYNLIIGIGAFPASLIFGILVAQAGFLYAFALGALLALASSVILLTINTSESSLRSAH